MGDFATFQVSNVPIYLRRSAFFETLNSEDDEIISLPANVLKQDTTVNSVTEATHLLSTLQFWGSDDIPVDLLKLFNLGTASVVDKVLQQFDDNFGTVYFLKEINRGTDAQRVNFALSKGKLDVAQFLISTYPMWDRDSACKHAAISGNLECLQYIHQQGGVIDRDVCAVAARRGFVDCFRYIYESGLQLDPFFSHCAMEGGHLPMVQYLHSLHCPWDSFSTLCAAQSNNIECLRYAHDNGCPWDADVATGAAASGHLETLQYLYSAGCPVDVQTAQNAAYHGRLECLRYLHTINCPWNRTAPAYAALRGHFDCLKFMHEHGCPWDAMTTSCAAEKNSLEIVRYAHERGCRISATVYRWAARYGNVEMMQYAHEQDVQWEHVREDTIIEASRSGSLQCLMLAHQQCCKITWDDALFAAAGGHLPCLKYLVSNCDVPAGEVASRNIGVTCAAAAEFGHLECLMYARSSGCAWDKRTCERAAARGSLECLKYAIDNDCPYSRKDCLASAARCKRAQCVDYLVSIGECVQPVVPRAKVCCVLS